MSKNLVVFFSASGVTKEVALKLAKAVNGDVYEIVAKQPYTDADLNWLDKNARSTVEMKDWNSRPEIVDNDAKIENYDKIFVGFPIWWYIAPTIINTFLEKYDFSNKTIILFATSGGSSFGRTVENIKPSVSDSTKIIEGKIFNNNPTVEYLKEWAENL